ncbi:MAG: FHA domain-containing protein [Fimbriimonadaceae bacterium]|nr:FHA domain-containing protein [Fimbriimonadaceae bacterium]
MNDPGRTLLGAPPTLDPNKTLMGNAPSLNRTATIKPLQCPVCKSFNPPGLIYCAECGLIFELAVEGDAFGAPTTALPVVIDPSGREHPIRPGQTILGRQGDVVVEDSRVSRRHACIHSSPAGLEVEDLGSTNGTEVNGDRLAPQSRRAVRSGDTISLGGFSLKVGAPGEAQKTQMPGDGRTKAMAVVPTTGKKAGILLIGDEEVALTHGTHSLGRRSDNDIPVADPHVSGRHGQVEVDDSGIHFTDIGSSNGTLLNGAKLPPHTRTRLQDSDVLKIGSTELRVKPRA